MAYTSSYYKQTDLNGVSEFCTFFIVIP